jgi:multiple sugar transport system substrate-binding protein
MSSRRAFLAASLSATGAALAPRWATAAPKAMTVVRESSFIKPFDDYFARTLLPEYEKLTGIKMSYEATSVGGMLTRLTTIAETKAGPEVAMTAINWPHLFDASLVDVTDVATEIGKKLGPWHDNVLDAVVVNKKWKALPWGNIGQLEAYRTDWFAEVGVKKFPDTWEDLLAAGRLLKKKGHPFGFELGHGFGDNHGWLYPLLWSYGGQEVDKDGKTVVIDSGETAKAVDFCRRFYKETMLEDVLGWTDVNNNKAYLGEQISCTNNASSILVVAKRDFPEIAKVTDHGLNPQGPKGRFHIINAVSHAVLNHADPAAAKPFLTKYDNHPMWNAEPRYLPYKESLKTSRLHGWPGPAGHALAESVAKYVLVDMFAKACRGDSTKDVIASAAAQLKQIYKAK